MLATVDKSEYADSIHMAAQLGRLDFISALLAVIGFAMVLGGIFTFVHYRNVAKDEAVKEAKKHAKQVAEETANRYLQAELPELLKAYAPVFGVQSISDKDADTIASAQEEE